jgi:hypothetical protein
LTISFFYEFGFSQQQQQQQQHSIPRKYDNQNNLILICPNHTKTRSTTEKQMKEETSLQNQKQETNITEIKNVDYEEKTSNTNAQQHICTFVYFVRLKVRDESGKMELILFDEDGVFFLFGSTQTVFLCSVLYSLMFVVFAFEKQQFFFGIPATDLYKNNVSLTQIEVILIKRTHFLFRYLFSHHIDEYMYQERMSRLLNPTNEMDCCVKSYCIENNTNKRRYRIFGTELL